MSPDTPFPFSEVVPMEPEPCRDPLESRSHIYQVKWDGVRMVAFVHNGAVRLQNRRLRDRTGRYPELAELGQVIAGSSAIIDGEVVAFWKGKPSFHHVMKRDAATGSFSEGALVKAQPVVFLAFDILAHNGDDLRNRPLLERYSILREVLPLGKHCRVVENCADGTALLAATKEHGLEGIVAKERSSPYIPGGKSPHWLKIKNFESQICVIGGYSLKGGRFSALLLGVRVGGSLVFVGAVRTGLTTTQIDQLMEVLPGLHREEPSLIGIDSNRSENLRWIEPGPAVLVRFLEWTPHLRLRSPIFEGFVAASPDDYSLTEIPDRLEPDVVAALTSLRGDGI